MSRIYVPGSGNPESKLMLVGMYPGLEECIAGQTMVGPTGREIQSILLDVGVMWPEIYATNIYKYMPDGEDVRKSSDWDKNLLQFWDEVQKVNPNVILTLGELPFSESTGLKNLTAHRGSVLQVSRSVNGRRIKVIPTIHPINYMSPRGKGGVPYSAKAYITLDFEKAVKESGFSDYRLPTRDLVAAESPSAFIQFLDAYQRKRRVSIDIETNKHCVPVCVAVAFNRTHAMSIPLQSARDATFSDETLMRFWSLFQELLFLEGLEIVGHNLKFDQMQLEDVCGFEFPRTIKFIDTSLLAHVVHAEFPRSLAFLASIYTDQPYYKDERKIIEGRASFKKLQAYNCKDVVVTLEVLDGLLREADEIKEIEGIDVRSFFFNYVTEMHQVYADMQRVGYKVDWEVHKRLYKMYGLMAADLARKIHKTVGREFNIGAPKQVGQVLFGDYGLPVRRKTPKGAPSADEAALVEILGSRAVDKKLGLSGLINNILDYRSLKLNLNGYLGALPDFDGRMRTQFVIGGADTGRTTTQILDIPVRPYSVGLALQTMPKHGQYGRDMRSFLVADDGYVIGSADGSQFEARIVANLANDVQLLQDFKNGLDVHWKTAGIALNFDYQTTKCPSKEDPRRFCGKETRHGGSYGMKWKRFVDMVNSDIRRFKIDFAPISPRMGKLMLERFHHAGPGIRGVFQEGIIKCLQDNKRVLINAYGRRRQFFDRWSDELFRSAFSYIPQSTVKDHVGMALLRIKTIKPSIRFNTDEHDAIGWLSPINEFSEDAEIIKIEFEKVIDFSRCSLSRDPLFVPFEVEYGFNRGQMKKYKGVIG